MELKEEMNELLLKRLIETTNEIYILFDAIGGAECVKCEQLNQPHKWDCDLQSSMAMTIKIAESRLNSKLY